MPILIWPCAALLLWLPPASAGVPKFAFDHSHHNFLRAGETWIPGPRTLMAVVNVGESMRVKVNITNERGEPASTTACSLLYKCSAEDSAYLSIPLWTSQSLAPVKDVIICSSKLQFQIARVSEKLYLEYNMKLLMNNLSYEISMLQLAEFRLSVNTYANILNSSSLFIFNMQIVSWPSSVSLNDHDVYRKYRITDDAVAALTGKYDDDLGKITKMKFLENEFLAAVRKTPKLIRSLLSITANVRAVTPGLQCDTSQLCGLRDSLVIFFSGDPLTVGNLPAPTKRGVLIGHISLMSGMLMFHNRVVHILANQSTNVFCACFRVSLNTNTWSHHVATSMEFRGPSGIGPLPAAPAQRCRINSMNDSLTGQLTIFAELTHVVIVSPIVCWDDPASSSIEILYVTFCEISPAEGEEMDGDDADECKRFKPQVRIHGDCTVIVQSAGAEHGTATGTLRFTCANSSVAFQYTVTIVSPPQFHSEGALLPKTPLKPGILATFNCLASFSGVQGVDIWPVIRASNGDSWVDFNTDEFATQRLVELPSAVVVRKAEGASNISLQAKLGYVSNKWLTWKLVFMCRSSLQSASAKDLFGISEYQVQTSTSVSFYSMRSASNYDSGTGGSACSAALVIGAQLTCLLWHQLLK